MSNVWADPEDRADTNRKRHMYEEAKGGRYTRVCGAEDSGAATFATAGELSRIGVTDFVADNNACERCIKCAGLEHIEVPSKGAESVDVDPFGVFDRDDGDESDRERPDSPDEPDEDSVDESVREAIAEVYDLLDEAEGSLYEWESPADKATVVNNVEESRDRLGALLEDFDA